MSKEADAVWAFAIENPDYWSLLKSEEEPAEVTEMEESKRNAFHAARREVRRRYMEILRAVWNGLRAQTKDTAAAPSFTRSKQDKSFSSAEVMDLLQGNKGKIRLAIEDSETGVLALYATFLAAKKRQSQQRELMAAAQSDGEWLYYEQDLQAETPADEIAKGLIEKVLPDLLKYLEAPEPTDD
jgi:hypothetical protein